MSVFKVNIFVKKKNSKFSCQSQYLHRPSTYSILKGEWSKTAYISLVCERSHTIHSVVYNYILGTIKSSVNHSLVSVAQWVASYCDYRGLLITQWMVWARDPNIKTKIAGEEPQQMITRAAVKLLWAPKALFTGNTKVTIIGNTQE